MISGFTKAGKTTSLNSIIGENVLPFGIES
jgi:hypothetical protein